MSTTDRDKILSRAKIGLMTKKDSVFISTIILSQKTEWADEIALPDGSKFPVNTACTDGVNLTINEKWFTGLAPLEQVGLLAHEAWHVAFQHTLPHRNGNRDPRVWNMAADHVINLMLLGMNHHLPPGGLHDPKFKDMSTEQVYNILIQDPKLQDPNFQQDFHTGGGGADPLTQQTHQNQVKDILVRAATQATLAGNSAASMPGDVMIALNKLLYPKLPWNVILHDFLNGMSNDDYTYAKGNRRFMPEFFFPSLYSEGMGTFACAIDTSGSVSDHDFRAFATEIDSAKEMMNPDKMFIVDFDTRINSVYEIGDGDNVSALKFKGRGGTDLQPVFDHFAKKPPHVLIIFSDLECDEITKNPGYPVIWIKTPGHGFNPSFGKVIEFDPN